MSKILKMEKRIVDAVRGESHISIINSRILGRTPIETSDIPVGRKGWIDTEYATLPDYLNKLLLMPFTVDLKAGDKDKLISKIVSDPQFMNDMSEAWMQSREDLRDMSFPKFASYGKANEKELAKAQVLVGSPLSHTPLSLGTHFNYADIPRTFSDKDWSWVDDAAKFFKEFTGVKRADTFSLPMFTSQGLLLKQRRDSKEWRVFSKALQTALALKCENYKQFDAVCQAFDDEFIKMGYNPVAKHFFLGVRRQHTIKGEPVQDRAYPSNAGAEVYYMSDGIQGRARGIFPPSEIMKAYYKPMADGLKKALFEKTAVCNVNPKHISVRHAYIAEASYKNDLITVDDENCCYYDLSGYDTNTHEGWNNLYMKFCSIIFDDFENIEGDMFKNSGLYFPGSPYSKDTMFMEIMGRSTLSGQPDVTVKNNIVHLLAMSHCLGVIRKEEPLNVFKQLITGEGDIVAGIHGDDTMLYFSDEASDYRDYLDELELLGLPAGFEAGPIYLKKTPMTVVDDKIHVYDKYDVKAVDAESAYDKYLSDLVGLVGEVSAESVVNNFAMLPIIGSLQKNRFGEYPTNNEHIWSVALQDTARLMDLIAPQSTKDLWSLMTKAGHKKMSWDQLVAGYDRELLSEEMLKAASGSIADIAKARSVLTRMFYSGFENIYDQDLERAFGSLFADSADLVQHTGLGDKSFEQLLDMAIRLQRQLIVYDGEILDVSEELEELLTVTKENMKNINSSVKLEVEQDAVSDKDE